MKKAIHVRQQEDCTYVVEIIDADTLNITYGKKSYKREIDARFEMAEIANGKLDEYDVLPTEYYMHPKRQELLDEALGYLQWIQCELTSHIDEIPLNWSKVQIYDWVDKTAKESRKAMIKYDLENGRK